MSRHCLSDLARLDDALLGASRVLIATDFDGTLCSIRATPREVAVSSAMAGLLRRLDACDRIVLAVISGRALADVAGRLSLRAIFAGNHGLEILGPGIEFRHPEAARLRPELEAARLELMDVASQWTGAWVEDKGLTLTLHYRNVDPAAQQVLLFAARGRMSRFSSELGMRAGRKALEIHPRIGWDKGSALQYIQLKTGVSSPSVAIGDDRTDEAMFRANRGGFNIRVGRAANTLADHYVSAPTEVALLFEHILGVVEHPAMEHGEIAHSARA
jgi:trehalose 6-phosphate phosphatase